MIRTRLALIPVPVTGAARPCAHRHGYAWLGAGVTAGTFMAPNDLNSKRTTRWSRRRPT